MGNEQSNTLQVPKIAHSNDWSLKDHIRHPLYGDVRVFQNKIDRSKFHAIKSYLFYEQDLFNQKLNELTLHNTIKIPSLVKIIDIETIQDSKLCSDFYKIIATYEYFPTTLLEEIDSKIKSHTPYTESQIYQIIDQILSVLIYLDFKGTLRIVKVYFKGQENSNLISSKVLVNKKNCKLVDQRNMIGVSDYQSLLIGAVDKENFVVAPEVLNALSKRRLNPNINFQKASVFNIGIICLELATLLHPFEFELYELGEYRLNQNNLQAYFNALYELKIYSKQLKSFIQNMLQVDPEIRYDFKDVMAQLQNRKSSCFDQLSPKRQSPKKHSPTKASPNNVSKLVQSQISNISDQKILTSQQSQPKMAQYYSPITASSQKSALKVKPKKKNGYRNKLSNRRKISSEVVNDFSKYTETYLEKETAQSQQQSVQRTLGNSQIKPIASNSDQNGSSNKKKNVRFYNQPNNEDLWD